MHIKTWKSLTKSRTGKNITAFKTEKISTSPGKDISPEFVDIVDSYFWSRFSPILTTSPAPIVINRSPFMQFSNKNFSIASKEGR